MSGPLDGVLVVDLTRALAGPHATQMLGDLGARVIKVEPPAGDEVRDWGPPFHGEDAAYFVGINRNKRSIGLDLAQPTGREVLLRLLEGADALIEAGEPARDAGLGVEFGGEATEVEQEESLTEVIGLVVAAMAWTSDHAGRHVYALSLPIERFRAPAPFSPNALIFSNAATDSSSTGSPGRWSRWAARSACGPP